MKIKKFKIDSRKSDGESSFLIKKITKTTTIIQEEYVGDSQGNLISVRDSENRKYSTSSKSSQGILAFSLNTKEPLDVEILEYEPEDFSFEKSNIESEKIKEQYEKSKIENIRPKNIYLKKSNEIEFVE